MPPTFIPGIELSRAYYREAVRPILDGRFPDLAHSAAMLGPGSEVQGFDTARSRDHNWGPRVDLYLRAADREAHGDAILAALSAALPRTFRGYGTHFEAAADEPGTILAADPGDGPLKPYIKLLHVPSTMRHHLGVDLSRPLTVRDWLGFPQQRLRALTGGEVFHDGLGALEPMRRTLAWYPDDVWRYLLAAGWRLVGQEEPFVGRTAEAGDELGSRVVAARLVRWAMQLALLQAKQYAPYTKWLGTAFSRQEQGSALERHLAGVLDARAVADRERSLCAAFEELARRQNGLGLSAAVRETVSPFHDRPYLVIHGEAIGEALEAAITDPAVRALPPGVGGIDQFVDNTDVLSHPRQFRAVGAVWDAAGSPLSIDARPAGAHPAREREARERDEREEEGREQGDRAPYAPTRPDVLIPSTFPTLTTERLTLRALAEPDVDDLFAIFSDPAVMRYWSRPPMQEKAEAAELLHGALEAFAQGESLRWALELRAHLEAPVIGTVSLFHLDAQNGRGEIGYALRSADWGKGLMHEALTAVVDYAFDTGGMDLGRLEADLDPRNIASLRSLERLGFQREGLLRERWTVAGETTDSLIMGLLRRERIRL